MLATPIVDGSGVSLGSLRFTISTAEGLRPEIARAFEARFGQPIAQALGIIEVGLVAVNDQPRAKPESIGPPLPDFAAELRDEDGRGVAPGSVGELGGEICIAALTVRRLSQP
jgi:benzoate-CoA ligase